MPSSLLPDVNDKRIFYRKLAERALAREEGEHRNMAVLRTMLARTEVLRVRFNAVDAILAPTDFMREMLTINGIDPDIVTVSSYGSMDTSSFRGAGDVPANVLDVSRAREELGWAAGTGLAEGMALTYDWIRNLPQSPAYPEA